MAEEKTFKHSDHLKPDLSAETGTEVFHNITIF